MRGRLCFSRFPPTALASGETRNDDRRGGTMLSEFRRKKMARVFDVYDVNKNGVLDQGDYERLAANLAKQRGIAEGTPAFAEIRATYLGAWTAMQKLANGGKSPNVTLSEWHDSREALLADPSNYAAVVKNVTDAVFNQLDVNEDDQISLEEYRLLYDIYEVDPAPAEEAFKVLDANHDGFLSRADVTKILDEYYYSEDPAAAGNWIFGKL
jgi:Ca2+-binding EF-hand superfamily protein